MSGTRSHSPPERATEPGAETLIIAAHGDCGADARNVLALQLARRIRACGRFADVQIGYVKCGRSIEEALNSARAANVRIYPLFMSAGYYVREAIPARLAQALDIPGGESRIRIEPPLGLHPGLPHLLLSAARAAAAGRDIDSRSATLLLVAHGSRQGMESAEAAHRLQQAIGSENAFANVAVAFLEQAPYFADALASAPRPLIVLGLFAGNGMHVEDDLRGAIRTLGDPAVLLVEQLGGYADVIEMIAEDLCH